MGNDFITALRPAIVMTILFALLLGIGYPLTMTGIGQAIFPEQANGSLVRDANGSVIGSTVIGESFTSDRYFDTRPSAAGKGYDGLASSGSNYGPTSRALADRVRADVAKAHNAGISTIPADLVTASGSGLDPDLSPAAAYAQAPRVARVRRLSVTQVRALIGAQTARPIAGFLGEERVNVLALNLALDRLGTH